MRWPPTLGVVGVDFGLKPAIAVAVPPVAGGIMRQQDDDPPLLLCHDLIGDTLNYALSGVIVCGGCYTVTLPDASKQDMKFSISGLNGTGALTWNGSIWQVVAGLLTASAYTTANGTCGGVPTDFSNPLTINVGCLGGNQMSAAIFTSIVIFGQSVFFELFEGGPQTFGIALTNILAIGDCGTVGVIGTVVSHGGTMTLTE